MMLRLLVAALLLLAPGLARAADPPPALTAAQAADLADTLQNDSKRAELLATLRSLAAVPVPAATTAAKPATTPAAAPAIQKPTLQPGSVGEELVGRATGWLGTIGQRIGTSIEDLRGIPALARWFGRIASDPQQRDLVLRGAGLALLIVVLAGFVDLVVWLLLRPFRRRIDAVTAPPGDLSTRHGRAWSKAKRLPGAIGRVAVGLLPTGAFVLTGTLLVGSSLVELQATRVITMDLIDTYVLYRLVLAVVDLLASPASAHWRLLEIADRSAAYAMRWTARLAGIALFGGLIATVAGVLGLPQSADQTVLKVVALGVHVGLVVVAWQCRHSMMRFVDRHGSLVPLPAGPEPRRAAIWAWTASVVIMLLWVIWAAQPVGGFTRIVRLVLVAAAIVICARLLSTVLLGALDRAFHSDSLAAGERRHTWHRRLRGCVAVLILLVTLCAILQSWGVDLVGFYRTGGIGPRLLAAFGELALIGIGATIVWELVVSALDRHMRTLSGAGRVAQAQRLRTLAPLLRTCLLVAIVTIVGLTALSEIGVNVAPLLAGASIFGVALGFGSQKLVQDFITGIFLLLENAMQVGEWVTVAGLSGTVEQLSVRTIQLRGGDGSLYVIPFSSVTTVNNTNRGIGNATISVTVAGTVDTDVAGAAIKQIGVEMRADPDFAGSIRSDLALWGVDKIDATTATLTGQIECTDAGRWGVQREFNRRVKKRFTELGIALANPATFVVMAAPPETADPGPHRERDPGESAATDSVSPPPHS